MSDFKLLAFHDWLATALDVPPAELGDAIDWLFREAISALTSKAVTSRSAAYERQRPHTRARVSRNPARTPSWWGSSETSFLHG